MLNPTKKAQLTIISCLFPSTAYQIITHAELKKHIRGVMHPIN
ncbi:Sortase A, LPXTG specific [Leuconostoc mesenteroides subsp. cremoris T26]|nr:Sortase A, LPXTG specific [Leuconostoc mesenteroides subsp. cremoris T26]